MWNSKALKDAFIEFFESKGHTVVKSSSVVPNNDPTLLFTNSGMVQFKNIFLGGEKPAYKRACSIQRCIRAGGKHNDLDDVGKDNYHHTFFEMMGNWSFGDYFKEQAISYAYEFLVETLKLDKERLYVTVYEELDKESLEIWRRYVDGSRIISASYKDNFWEMGEYGPCGPCTEIHYDRIGGRDASSLVNTDDPDVIEIWNIVFIEYSKTPSGMTKLGERHIDTGIGFERLLSILMGVRSNYLIDSFRSIISHIEQKCRFRYGDGGSKEDVAFRVVADHSRTMVVCLNDRVSFSNEGVGYVLRRILRRSVRYGYEVLGLEIGDMADIVRHASGEMGIPIDVDAVLMEENLFAKTLKNGVIRFNKMVESKGRLTSEDVFLLYDTYGFPKDLTELMAREKNVEISLEDFEKYKKAAQERSHSTKSVLTVNFPFGRTDDAYKYTKNGISADLQAIVHNNEIVSAEEANALPADSELYLVFDRTCFYGEKGGQSGDRGEIKFLNTEKGEAGLFLVQDVQIIRGYVVHRGTKSGRITKSAVLVYDEALRKKTMANHTAAHLLYYFLRRLFPTAQRGSLVDSEKCRFDFEGQKLSDEQLVHLEQQINGFIKENVKREVQVLTKEEAMGDPDLHLEDEDYSRGVRIVVFKGKNDHVKDPCGGTHADRTGDIEDAVIISETGIQANIRRMLIYTGAAAREVREYSRQLEQSLERGEVVTFDRPVQLLLRKKLEEKNRENVRTQQKRYTKFVNDHKEQLRGKLNESVNATEKPASEMLEDRMERLSIAGANDRSTMFIYEIRDKLDFPKKDVAKIAFLLGEEIRKMRKEGVVLVKGEDEISVCISLENRPAVYDAIRSDSGNMRISKDMLCGSIPDRQEDRERLLGLLNREP